MIIITCPSPPPWTSSCSTTWIGPSNLVTHLDARISPNRFHQLAKTKLGLSPTCRSVGLWVPPVSLRFESRFPTTIEIQSSPFIQINLNLSCLSKHYVHELYLDKLHKFGLVVISSPYICARWVWNKALHICIDMNCGRVNNYQMMLRCKEWTFEAWYHRSFDYTILSTMSS